MNKTLKIIISAVVALVIVVLCVSLVNKSVPLAGGNPDFSNSPYLVVNGSVEWFSQSAMVSGAVSTTTGTAICSIQAPTASSSITNVSVRFGTVSTSTTYTIGTSTVATTAPGVLATGTATAGAGYYFKGLQDQILNSGEYINVVMATTSSTLRGGQCQARFMQY